MRFITNTPRLLGAITAMLLAFGQPAFAGEPLQPLPPAAKIHPDKTALGKRLFHDPQLSADNSISCASCHNLETGGVDGIPRSIGIGGQMGGVNAPTVYNSCFNFKQFWDGRAGSLEEQAAGPVHNPIEMGSDWTQVIAKLRQDSTYVAAFNALYPDGIQGRNIQDAIAAFERILVTPSRFDRYLHGDETAITENEKKGYVLFKSYGCTACHQGINVGGNMFQKLGFFGDYFKDRGKTTPADQGRFNVTGKEKDRHRFKVPSLRNAALTAPYFHHGEVDTLDQAVDLMSRYQLGRKIPPKDKRLIVEFLHALTGADLEQTP